MPPEDKMTVDERYKYLRRMQKRYRQGIAKSGKDCWMKWWK